MHKTWEHFMTTRYSSFLALVLSVVLSGVAAAQDPPAGGPPADGPPVGGAKAEGGRGGPGMGGRGFGRGGGLQLPRFPLLEALDQNKDGKLSKQEIDGAVEALKSIDKDSDGKLSQEEIGWPPAFMGRGGPGMGGRGFRGGPGGGPGEVGAGASAVIPDRRQP
jgi:hypothetical protein